MSGRSQISERGAPAASHLRNGFLNARQQKFVLEYLRYSNATQAAISAGYSVKCAASIGARLLRNVEIATEIAKVLTRGIKEAEVTIERVLKEYARIAFADIAQAYDADGNLLPVLQMPEDIRRALTGVEITELYGDGERIGKLMKVRFAQKVSALDSLARYLGMMDESGNVGAGLSIVLNLGQGAEEPQHAIESRHPAILPRH